MKCSSHSYSALLEVANLFSRNLVLLFPAAQCSMNRQIIRINSCIVEPDDLYLTIGYSRTNFYTKNEKLLKISSTSDISSHFLVNNVVLIVRRNTAYCDFTVLVLITFSFFLHYSCFK